MESRRRFLKWATSIAIGAGILLITENLAKVSSLTQNELIRETANDSANSRASLLTVKVHYSMMIQYIGLSDEYFVLQSPADIRDLLNTVVIRHPSMKQMVSTMLILLKGIPAKSDASLKDGDELQFIPLSAGG